MQRTPDAIPECLIDELSRKQTVELCRAEHEGHHCVLRKGHDGMHEGLALAGEQRWR